MQIKVIDGVLIHGLDKLEQYLKDGCEIEENFDGADTWHWILSDENGEVLYMGSTLRELLVNIILGG